MRESVRLYGASPPGLCAYVYVGLVRAQKGFVRYEPARALNSVLVLAHQGFVPSHFVLVLERVQVSKPVHLYSASLQGLYTVCWCSPTRALCPMLMCSCELVCR